MSFPSTYYESVLNSLKRRPGLKIVSDFMSTPACCYRFDVLVTHILSSGELHSKPIVCRTKKDLETAIGPSAPANRVSTIICAEDLTNDVIEALGSIFSIEPEFFALHLRAPCAFRSGAWSSPTAPTLDMLPSYLREAPFYSLEFRRPYEFPGGLNEVIKARKDPYRTHVPRSTRRTEGLPVAFMDERVSVYTKRNCGSIDYGIILTDRLIKPDKPVDTVDSISFFDKSDTQDRSTHVSARTELLSWLQKLPSPSRQVLFSPHEPVALRPLIKLIEQMSSAFLAYAHFHLNRIVHGHFDVTFPDTYNFSLVIYRNFHRQIYDQQQILNRAVGMAAIKGVTDVVMEQQKEDIKTLTEEMQLLLARLEQDVQILHSNFAIQQAALVSRLTKLAFLFLPLSTVATILAINGPESRFVIFGAISVPFVLISATIMFFSVDFSHPDSKKFTLTCRQLLFMSR